MAFGNRDGIRGMPRSFAACTALWTPRRANKGYHTLAGNTDLRFVEASAHHPAYFAVRFHGHLIVRIYADHTELFACGYTNSPTTIGRLNSFTSARVDLNNALGYEAGLRIQGYPFFDGIRVYPSGQVFPEDIRSDYFTRPKKSVVQEYVKLFNWIKKHLRLRFELGEFKPGEGPVRYFDLAGLNQMRLANDTFIPHDTVTALFIRGVVPGSLAETLAAAREHYRHDFYRAFDGFERVEVKNA